MLYLQYNQIYYMEANSSGLYKRKASSNPLESNDEKTDSYNNNQNNQESTKIIENYVFTSDEYINRPRGNSKTSYNPGIFVSSDISTMFSPLKPNLPIDSIDHQDVGIPEEVYLPSSNSFKLPKAYKKHQSHKTMENINKQSFIDTSNHKCNENCAEDLPSNSLSFISQIPSFIQVKDQNLTIESKKIDNIRKYFNIPSNETINDLDTIICQYAFNTDNIPQGSPIIKGIFGVTHFSAFFYSDMNLFNQPVHANKMRFPLAMILKVLRNDKYANKIILDIYLKDLRIFKLIFNQSECSVRIVNTLNKYLEPKSSLDIYAFRFFKETNLTVNGWDILDIKKELIRQGFYSCKSGSSDEIKQTALVSLDNSEFQICNSYPFSMIVATPMEFKQFMELSRLFSKNRFPVMTWYCKKRTSSLWISGSFKGYTSVASTSASKLLDEYISAIKNGCDTRKINIFDTRKYNKIKFNELKEHLLKNKEEPFFFELEEYTKLKSRFIKMTTIEKGIEANKKIFSSLESIGYLDQIASLLKSAFLVCKCLKVSCII